MRGEYIDFISSYCDRWCERCAFTNRCSTYAIEIAVAMCEGDMEAGLELAVGAAPPETEAEKKRREAFLESLADCEPTPQEIAQFTREAEERAGRIEELPVTTMSETTHLLSRQWLQDQRERVLQGAPAALAEAIEVAGWDSFFIPAKLQRALKGRDEAMHGEGFDEDPIQCDWNGSAKVALISIERSAAAWTLIAQSMQDAEAARIANELERLRREVERLFPDARKFIRPGFDAGGESMIDRRWAG